jgi:hypothetical protein
MAKSIRKTHHRGTGKAIQIALGKHDHLTGSSDRVGYLSTPIGVD